MDRDSRFLIEPAFLIGGSSFTACNHKGERKFLLLSRILCLTFKKRLPGRSFWKLSAALLDFFLGVLVDGKKRRAVGPSVPGQVFEFLLSKYQST
jgi:hypothetical protein